MKREKQNSIIEFRRISFLFSSNSKNNFSYEKPNPKLVIDEKNYQRSALKHKVHILQVKKILKIANEIIGTTQQKYFGQSNN